MDVEVKHYEVVTQFARRSINIVSEFERVAGLDADVTQCACATRAMGQGTQIVAVEKDLQKRINAIEAQGAERTCVRIYATTLTIEEYRLKGKDLTRGWRTWGGGPKTDPYKIVLLSDIEEIYCD